MARNGDKRMKRASESQVVKSLALTPAKSRHLDAVGEIAGNPGRLDDACFLHSVLCQAGMPRKRTKELRFERTSGLDSLLLTAGELWTGREWVQQELPYGPKPRLILINLTTAAVLTKSPIVDVGRSTRDFMQRVGLDAQGSEYRSLRKQVSALAACRMQLGTVPGGKSTTTDGFNPISSFDVWIVPNADQQTLWPGTVELSRDYFDSVLGSAVPLDERAIAALRGTALGLDVYAWLGHRLCRIRESKGVPIRWEAIKSQFGQEYKSIKAFRQEFRETLRQVLGVYPGAKLEPTPEGIRLRQSPPPIPPRLLIPGV